MDTIWVEDLELGRGYILVSDMNQNGNIWRFEIGGGPIPIGKSLHMMYSGCRSQNCHYHHQTEDDYPSSSSSHYALGSRGMTVQVQKDESTFTTGKLIIVEYGELRIVRMEEDGSRTPLVINVTPSLCEHKIEQEKEQEHDMHSTRRIQQPNVVYYTPFGDLLFTEQYKQGQSTTSSTCSSKNNVAGLYRLKEIAQIPPLSFETSKDAHMWTFQELQEYYNKHSSSYASHPDNAAMELFYSGQFEYISDVVVGKDLISLYIAGRISDDDGNNVKYVIVKVAIDDDDDDDDDEEKETLTNDTDDDDDDDDDDDAEKEEVQAEQDIHIESKPLHDNGDVDDDDDTRGATRRKGLLDDKATTFYDMSSYFSGCEINGDGDGDGDNDIGISLAIDEHGFIYASYPNGIAILNDITSDENNGNNVLVGTLSFQQEDRGGEGEESDRVDSNHVDDTCASKDSNIVIPTSMNIGKDRYLYITSDKGLLRMTIKSKPLDHPTNLIVPSSRKSAT